MFQIGTMHCPVEPRCSRIECRIPFPVLFVGAMRRVNATYCAPSLKHTGVEKIRKRCNFDASRGSQCLPVITENLSLTPVQYRGDIGNSSSGVSSSISSAASSPPPHPEGGPLLVSPTRHPPPPAKTEPTRDQLANHVTAIPADTADATMISVNTADMIPNTAETALIPDDTTDTAMIPADTANTTVIPADTRVESDDIIPIISPTGSTAITDLKFDSDDTTAVYTEPPVYASTTVDPVDTANAMTDPFETANMTLDNVDITVDKTNSTKSFTKQASANSTTDQIDATDTATANPTDSSESTTDQIDTTDTVSANPADQVDTSNVSTGTPDITNTATDTAEPSVKNEAVEKKGPTMAAGGREEETKVEEEKNEEKEEEKNEEKEDEQKDEEKERGLTAAGNELPSAVDPSSGQHKPQTSIDKQLEGQCGLPH